MERANAGTAKMIKLRIEILNSLSLAELVSVVKSFIKLINYDGNVKAFLYNVQKYKIIEI